MRKNSRDCITLKNRLVIEHPMGKIFARYDISGRGKEHTVSALLPDKANNLVAPLNEFQSYFLPQGLAFESGVGACLVGNGTLLIKCIVEVEYDDKFGRSKLSDI